MDIKTLKVAREKIIALLTEMEKSNNVELDDVSIVELMLNIDKFLSPQDYDKNIKTLQLIRGSKFQRRDIDETYKYTE